MFLKGIEIPSSTRYVKFHKSVENKKVSDDSLHTLDFYCTNTGVFNAVKSFPIEEDTPEYIKLPKVDYSLTLPGLVITKLSYEPLIVSIIIAAVDEENRQVDGDDQSLHNTLYYNYDRLTILLRSDKRSVKDLSELLSDLPYIRYQVIDEDAQVGNLTTTILRNKDISEDYITTEPVDFNGQVSVVDWSHAFDGLLQLAYSQVSVYGFDDPMTKIAQEITTNKNQMRYSFSNIEEDGRGHLVGNHWKYFYMHKMPFELEFLMTETQSYVRLLHEMQMFNKVTNIGSYKVKDNNNNEWNVAVEWIFPIENSFDVDDPRGSSDTVGTSIKLSGILHFFTVAKDKFMGTIQEILLSIEKEDDLIVINK